MKRYITKKRVIVAAAVAAAVAIAGGAFAYFTSSGSGTGTASVGTSSNVVITATVTGTLFPGGDPAQVSFSIQNPGSGNEFVNTISYAGLDGNQPSGCLGSWFHLNSDTPVSVAHNIAHGATYAVPGTFDLSMADTGTSQDACAGASLTFNFSSN